LEALAVIVPSEALAAATQIINRGDREGVRLRLLGGLAFKALCRSAHEPEFRRENKDIDLMGRREDAKSIMQIMETLGYRPREMFNKLNMGKRLIYHDSRNGRRVDIFLDEFEMCHKFKFKHTLVSHPLTLSITNLVITKLQVVEMTEKEFKDLAAAFNDYEVTAEETGINGERIAELCSRDWGIYRTFTGSLMRLRGSLRPLNGSSEKIASEVDHLLGTIERSPKTLSWKLRAKIGESIRWYELPEADGDPS